MTDLYDASDSKVVDKSIKSAKDRAARLREALKGIMSGPSGREWLYHLLVDFESAYQSPFSKDPILMAYQCGGHNIVLQLLIEMENCSPDLYLTMVKENQQNARSSHPESRQSRLNGDSVADTSADSGSESDAVT